MTYVSTPKTGALPKQGSSKRFGRMAAAVAVVVAAGAAIATGIAVTQQDSTPLATESIYTEQLELLKAETYAQPGVQATPDRADQVHRGRAPAITAESPTRAEMTQDLVNRGLIPAATLEATVNPADRVQLQKAGEAGASETTPFVEQPGGPK